MVQSFVGMVLKGKRAVPIPRIGQWADQFPLEAREREEFRIAALMTHCPPELYQMFEELSRKHIVPPPVKRKSNKRRKAGT